MPKFTSVELAPSFKRIDSEYGGINSEYVWVEEVKSCTIPATDSGLFDGTFTTIGPALQLHEILRELPDRVSIERVSGSWYAKIDGELSTQEADTPTEVAGKLLKWYIQEAEK